MVRGKRLRQHGKVRFSEYFKKIPSGDRVTVIKDSGFAAAFPKRILGRTGVVEGMRGNFAIVKLNDGNNPKTFIIHPIHLKKLKMEKK